MPELPRYRSHKIVRAAKIVLVEAFQSNGAASLVCQFGNMTATVGTRPGWQERFKGADTDNGYFVVYEDGYESWSPSKAFEEGYTRIDAEEGHPKPSSFGIEQWRRDATILSALVLHGVDNWEEYEAAMETIE